MALVPAKIIVRVRGTYTSDVAELPWEWAMRADGQVCRRMTAVNRHRERNPWQPVTRVPAADLQLVRMDHTHAGGVLAEITRQHGHAEEEIPREAGFQIAAVVTATSLPRNTGRVHRVR